ncbi:MAG: sulfatase family protein [Candidatus Cyclobacteriaceae bacterium M3_2C_046]
MKDKSIFLFLMISLIYQGCQVSSGEKNNVTEEEKPNILVILTDDQGFGDLSSYGAKDLQTPNIDGLVEDGMKFSNFYANCPVCSPTRAALLTGRYQEYVGVPGVIRTHQQDSWGFLDTAAILLPEPLNQAGYKTGIIGKWHLGLESPNTPNERGFQYFKGFLGDMMDDYWTHERFGNNYMRLNDSVIEPEGHATDLFSDWAVDYVTTAKEKGKPWFLYLAYNAPHFPVQPPEDWLVKVKQREPDISDTRAKLVAFIEHMDDGIGRVIQSLKETEQYDHTLIFFTSDNGGHLPSEANNGPWRDGKQSVYEGGIRVPACAVWPGKIKPGSSSEAYLLTMDIYPTVLAAAGAGYAHRIEGQDFLPILLEEEQRVGERPLFFSRREGNMRYRGQAIEAVRSGQWKLLQNNPFEPQELYNMEEDPYETNNVFDQYPEKVKELNQLLMKHKQIGARVPWQPPAVYYEF